jgi:uncharacterized iron-regulated membrane protein
MAWLHTWSGLLLGWLMFLIFVTGSLSFFRSEINFWMRPELHRAYRAAGGAKADSARMIAHARRVLEQEAPDSPQWQISLPGPRFPALSVSWRASESSATPPGGRRGHVGRPAMKRLLLDPSTGDILKARETAGADFLFRLHFQLYGIDAITGRWIIGAGTMVMLIALISGVIVHRNIFRDFFTFRPNKGKRSWMDAHVLTSAVSLPFHFVIAFSGLLLLAGQLMWPVMHGLYPDARAFVIESRGGRARFDIEPPSGTRVPLTDFAPLFETARQRWPERPPDTIVITNPGDSRASIEIRQSYGGRLANRAAPERLFFDGAGGELLDTPKAEAPSAILAVWNALTALHMGRFATPAQRWLLFFAGICGAAMVASGLVLWRISRLGKHDEKSSGEAGEALRMPFGCRLVEVFNVAGIAGLLAAIGVYFWGCRLLPGDLALRVNWEIALFFIAWGVLLFHAALARHLSAWAGQLAFSGILFAFLPLLNGLTGGASLFRSIAAGYWQVAGFDLCALFAGALLLFAAWKVHGRAAGGLSGAERPLPQPVAGN